MEINQKQILEGFLEDISDISDKEYQRRIWIRGEGPECDDFDEAVCRYSPAADYIINEYKAYDISDIQLHVLKKFHEEYEKFWVNNHFPQLFIDTPEWTKITLLAKQVLEAFNYQKKR